jgi:hypothetical protein
MNRIRRTETHNVLVKRKWFVTKSMACAFVLELGSNKIIRVKFNDTHDAETLMYDIPLDSNVIVRGFMGEFNGEPEFTVNSYEIRSKAMKTFYPSEDIEYVVAKPMKKTSN